MYCPQHPLNGPHSPARLPHGPSLQIRVFGFARVTNGFDARKHCDKRRYEYILPAWAFDPAVCQPRPQQQRAAAATAKQQAQTQQAEGEALRQTEGDAPQHEAGEQQAEGEAPQAQEQQQGGAAEGGEQQQAQQDAAGAGSGPEAAANGGGAPAEAPVAGVLEAAEDESDMAVELGEESEQGDPTLTAEEEREEEEAAAGSTFVFDQACADRLTAILSQVGVGAPDCMQHSGRRPRAMRHGFCAVHLASQRGPSARQQGRAIAIRTLSDQAAHHRPHHPTSCCAWCACCAVRGHTQLPQLHRAHAGQRAAGAALHAELQVRLVLYFGPQNQIVKRSSVPAGRLLHLLQACCTLACKRVAPCAGTKQPGTITRLTA